jgi:uncharacterized protein (DUF1697 family)
MERLMEIYFAFLRGINVSGKNIIKMDALKKLFEDLGFSDVVTYIQSGNVIFKTKKLTNTGLENIIEDSLHKTFGLDVKVIVKTINELENILAENPFPEKSLKENERIYITLLSGIPLKENMAKLDKFSDNVDEFRLSDKTIYLLCKIGYGKTLFSNSFFEKKLYLSATTRNWETMNKILYLSADKCH